VRIDALGEPILDVGVFAGDGEGQGMDGEEAGENGQLVFGSGDGDRLSQGEDDATGEGERG